MTEITIHRVKTIRLVKTYALDNGFAKSYEVLSSNGERTEISLFSESLENLNIIPEDQ